MSYDARPPGFKTPRRDDDSHLESDGDTVPPSSQISSYTDFRLSSPGPEFTSIHSRSDASLHDTGSSARDLGPPSSPASARPPIAPRSMRPYVPHDTREVTPPPTKTPTPDYLALAAQSPIRLEGDPSLSRKLLILDLNGTLLHRAAANIARRERRHPHHPGEPLLDGKPKTMDPSTRPLPRLRPVHPRPYMPSFRNYLFTPQTKEWLDAMIWSSAQPYSVEDMVDKTFGETKEGLVAVWARDTLGLTAEQYSALMFTYEELK